MKSLKETKEFFAKLYYKCDEKSLSPYDRVDLRRIKGIEEHMQNLDYMIKKLPPKEELQKDPRVINKELSSITSGTSQFCAKHNLVKKVLKYKNKITDKDHILDALRITRAYFIIYPE